VSDLETRLRETLVLHADRVEPAQATAALLRRARRRLARTVVASVASVLALTAAGAWSVRTATAEPVRPVHHVVVPNPAVHNGDLAYVAGPLDTARLVIPHSDGSVSSIDAPVLRPSPARRTPW